MLVGSEPRERPISQQAATAALRPFKAIPLAAFATALAVVVMGVTLGLIAPSNVSIPEPYTKVSSIIGWTYFAAWSISFYPQLYDNYRRKSVVGLSFDFVVYSFIGFFCYSVYTIGMYSFTPVREAYRRLHGTDNDVAANDVLFALHSLVMTMVALWQCYSYHRGDQTVSALCQRVTWIWAVGTATAAGAILHLQSKGLGDASVMWLYFIYAMSLLKLVSTIVKYIPQMIMNHVTRSTKGWSIGNVLLDVVGGVLSIGQSILDSVVSDDWSVLLGNPIRSAMGFYSIFFDCIFLVQHYVCFPDSGDEDTQQLRKEKQPDRARDGGPEGSSEQGSTTWTDQHV